MGYSNLLCGKTWATRWDYLDQREHVCELAFDCIMFIVSRIYREEISYLPLSWRRRLVLDLHVSLWKCRPFWNFQK